MGVVKCLWCLTVFFILTVIGGVLCDVNKNANPSILIIGAGPSGIAAATKLLQNNFTNVLILEAENRTGGRVHSVKFGDAFVDLGAEWCHGQKDNVVYDLVKDLDVLQSEFVYRPEIHHSKKKRIDPEFADELINIFWKIYVPDGEKEVKEGKNLGEYCIERFSNDVSKKFGNDSDKESFARNALDLFHKHVLTSEGSFTWFEPSALSDYRVCEGGDYSWGGHGYKTALNVMIEHLPEDKQKIFKEKLLLGKEVSKVIWNKNKINPGNVTLKCNDGTTYSAKHVIFTPSLGVLKKEHQQLFMPQLPNDKQKVIKSLGIAGVMKIVLHFPQKLWFKDDFNAIILWWDEKDLERIPSEFPEGVTPDGQIWIKELFLLLPLDNNENALSGWVTGDLVPIIEQLPEKTVIDGCYYAIKKFLGYKYNVTRPDQMIRTKWFTNPHFRGSYSYQTVESRKHKISPELELSKPLPNEQTPSLLFAGEATNPVHYSTVHGAIETGYREADRIMNAYK